MNRKPYIVGIGGTSRPNSSSELALRQVLQDLEGMGAQVELFTGHALSKLPIYGDEVDAHDDLRESFIKALREADGVVISSPCYHGGTSASASMNLPILPPVRPATLMRPEPAI